MKNFIKKYVAWIVLIISVCALIPTLGERISNEEKNDNVTLSLFYQNLSAISSKHKLNETLDEYKKIGVNTISIKEDDINFFVSKGDVTSIKYNVLRHKYDDESMEIARIISEKCPDISDDSHLLMVKRPEMRERISKAIGLYFTNDDCMTINDVASMDIYVFYDGRRNLWDIPLGYDEDIIKELSQKGFDIALMHKVNGYGSLKYLDKMETLIKENDNIKYINIQKGGAPFSKKNTDKTVDKLSDIINSNGITLVVTENADQLSNQKPDGYSKIFSSVMGEKGSKKLLRSYETYDNSQEDESHYKFRAQQYFNSTLDRNIRFINITQIISEQGSYNDCIEYTLNGVKEYKDKIIGEGFSVNGEVSPYNYKTDRIFAGAVSAVIMIMCMLIMLMIVFGINNMKLTLSSLVIALLAFFATYKMPPVLFDLYPTLYSVVMSCFAMTAALGFVKYFKDKAPSIFLALGAIATVVISVLAGSVGLASMLSGIDFYANNLIFRGIKLSLLVPVAYTAVAYYFMFIKTEDTDMVKSVKKILFADIKVYWVIIGAIVGFIGMYYITRSGNVSKISSLEQTLRNTMTDLFPERPRTKEFLIGYPALVLFVYYTKNVDIKLIKWLFAIASSILAASLTNSFCHVFTDYSTIAMRVINGLLVGLVVSAFAYVANLLLVKICRNLKAKLKS